MLNIFRSKTRSAPRLNASDTGNVVFERPYAPAAVSLYGDGGIPTDRVMGKFSPGVVVPSQTVLEVSIGGSTADTYEGSSLDYLVNTSGSRMI